MENNIVKTSDISYEMRTRYPVYACDVIEDRALPDVRDGLKPVHRRIEYAMNELGLIPEKGYRKCARIVGDVLGKYHPHGDTSVYDALVRLAQDFSMRHPFVDGHGNFGSIDGDSAAAMRYTEAKMSKIAIEMLRDINKNVVDFKPNFDGEEQEPVVLPSRYPNVLVNGSFGIAVGMATNIPPHNLGECIEGCIAYTKNSDITTQELMNFIKAPDFPTGGKIINEEDLLQIYEKGFGKIIIQSKYHIENEDDKKQIVFTEIPYQVNKQKLCERISEILIELPNNLSKNVLDLRDESDREGMRIVVELKKNANENTYIPILFKKTKLQDNFNANFNVLVNKVPKVLGLKDIIKEYINFQREIITRRSNFELDKSNKRIHILEGLLIALDNLDEVVETIKKSTCLDEAKHSLRTKFKLSETQCQNILEMKLRRLTGLERGKIEEEYLELSKHIKFLTTILNNKTKLDEVLISELQEIKDKYNDDRQTEIIQESEIQDISKEELIEDYNCRILLTQEGYIKKHSKQSDNHKLKENDIVLQDFTTTNKSTLLFLTNKANRYKLPVYELDLLTPPSYGQYIPNIIQLETDEKVIKVVSITDQTKGYIYTAYSNGKLGKVDIKSFMSNNKKLQNCYNIDSELLDICYSEKDIDVIMVSSEGKSIIFNTSKINSKQSRNTQGVTSMKLADGLCVVNAKLDVDKDYKIQLETSSSKQKEVYLNDVVSSTDDREMYKYLSLKHGNQGNFIWNMRSYKDDKIAKVTFIK